jgi:hypothetical protein
LRPLVIKYATSTAFSPFFATMRRSCAEVSSALLKGLAELAHLGQCGRDAAGDGVDHGMHHGLPLNARGKFHENLMYHR